MKRLSILLLLAFQILFSQKVHIKGVTNDSGKFPNNGGISVIVNDTFQKLLNYNRLIYKNNKEKAKQEDKTINPFDEYQKEQKVLEQLRNNKNYIIKTDNSGNFEIDAKPTDSLFFKSQWHITKKYLVADLVKKKNINIKLKPEPCEVWPSHPEKPTKLYVFVGKKIKVWNSPEGYCNALAFNSRTLAKYEVVQNIYGNYPNKTIEFTSYSHEVIIPQNYSPCVTDFSQSDYSLLYILKYDGENIQVKYLFDDVYLTTEGKWASPIKPVGSINYIEPTNLEPQKINFIKPVVYSYDEKFENQMKQIFPKEYRNISDGKIVITHGFYVKDLFEYRKIPRLKEYDYLIK